MSRRSFDDPHGETTAARQALLDNRCEHATKRHRVRKRSKKLSAKKKSAIKHASAVNNAKRKRKSDAARAYWRGERPDHP